MNGENLSAGSTSAAAAAVAAVAADPGDPGASVNPTGVEPGAPITTGRSHAAHRVESPAIWRCLSSCS